MSFNKMQNVKFIDKRKFDKSNKMVVELTHPEDDSIVVGKLTTDKIEALK